MVYMTIYAIFAGILAVVIAVWKAFSAGKSAGAAGEARRHKDAYTSHLENVARAADARNNARELHDDPNRRD